MQRYRITIEIDTEVSRNEINQLATEFKQDVDSCLEMGIVVYVATEIVEQARNIIMDQT